MTVAYYRAPVEWSLSPLRPITDPDQPLLPDIIVGSERTRPNHRLPDELRSRGNQQSNDAKSQ